MPKIETKFGVLPWNLPKPVRKQWTRDDNIAKMYNSSRWEKLRLRILNRDKFCLICMSKNIVTIADTVDHIKPVSKGGGFWDEANLQGCCKPCNNRKKDE